MEPWMQADQSFKVRCGGRGELHGLMPSLAAISTRGSRPRFSRPPLTRRAAVRVWGRSGLPPVCCSFIFAFNLKFKPSVQCAYHVCGLRRSGRSACVQPPGTERLPTLPAPATPPRADPGGILRQQADHDGAGGAAGAPAFPALQGVCAQHAFCTRCIPATSLCATPHHSLLFHATPAPPPPPATLKGFLPPI